MKRTIFDELKYLAIENGYILNSVNQRYEIYEVDGLDCYFNEHDFSSAIRFVNKELNGTGVSIEFFQISKLHDSRLKSALKSADTYITKNRLNYFDKNLTVKRVRKYICISTDKFSKNFPDDELRSGLHQSFFRMLGLGFKKLDTLEIKELLYNIISLDEDFRFVNSMSHREQILQSQISYTPDYMKIGNKYVAVLSLKNLPDHHDFFWLDYILDFLQYEYYFMSSIFVPDQNKEKVKLTLLRNTAKSIMNKSQNVDHEAEINYKDAETLKGDITAKGHTIVFSTQKIILWEESLPRLKKICETIQDDFRYSNFYFFPETLFHDKEFFRTLPGQTILSERGNKVLSQNALALLPLSSVDQGDVNQPFPLLLRSTTGQLFGFDAGSDARKNWNSSIYGASGGGKSVTMNMLIAFAMYPRIKAENGKIFIVDFAGEKDSSYKKLAQLFGGSFIPFDASGKYSINPFPPRSKMIKDGEFNADHLTFLGVCVDTIIGNVGDTSDCNLIRGIVSKALVAMYKDVEAPTLRDLPPYIENVNTDDIKLKSLVCTLLSDFLDESNPASKIIAGKTNIEYSDKPFVIFDLHGISKLPEKLQALLTFIVINEANKSAFEINGASFVILDEAAQLINDPKMKKLIIGLFMIARKSRTGVWTVTQNFKSFFDSGIAGEIRLNTTTTILLSHDSDTESKDFVAEKFGFTQKQKEAFVNLEANPKTGNYLALFLSTYESGETSAVIRMELSPFGFQLTQSDRIKNEYLEAVARKNKVSLIRACQMVANGED